jgi:hypothetical protein
LCDICHSYILIFKDAKKNMYKVEPVAPEVIAERASRIREVRRMLGMTRKELVDLGLALGSVQNWEDGRQNGLTQKGAGRLVEAFRLSGAIVTEQWLMEGEEPGPVLAPKTIKDLEVRPAICSGDIDKLVRDILHLLYANVGPIADTIISSDVLAPMFFTGDCVAGIRYTKDEADKALEQFCIVQTADGKLLVGYLSKTPSGEYQLTTHWQNKEKKLVDVYSAAPIAFRLGRLDKL